MSQVVPLAIDLGEAEIDYPLGQFHAEQATEEGVLAIVKAIDTRSEEHRFPRRDSQERWRPDLEKKLHEIEERNELPPAESPTRRSVPGSGSPAEMTRQSSTRSNWHAAKIASSLMVRRA